MMTLRLILGLMHRWVGLVIAGFLIVSGITGAIISWDHELDDLLNPQLMHARATGPALATLPLAKAIEARDPRVRVTSLPLSAKTGEAYVFDVAAKVDPATRQLFKPGYNQVFVDPATGSELGRRDWGAVWPVTSENLVSFLYVLHYSLHLPEMWGIDRWGVWLLGVVAVLWTIDSFVGFYLTLPSRQAERRRGGAGGRPHRGFWTRWQPAWTIKTGGSRFRLNFDLHRAFGLWLWGLLLMLAFTAFSLNLYSEVFYPVLSKVSKVTPSPFDTRVPREAHDPITPTIGYDRIAEIARAEAARRGWPEPAGSMFYSAAYGIYGVGFHVPGGDHGASGVGPPYLYFDSNDGRLLGDRQPWTGTAADIFVQAQFPLHSGRVIGLPGRILVSFMGLVVAMLSVTGLVIWMRKRAARVARKRQRQPSIAQAGTGLMLAE